jgi:glycosyltransferase involved in cell wall biosynthesis
LPGVQASANGWLIVRRYKIVHVISSLMVGGAEVMLLAAAARLRDHGFDSEVLVLGEEGALARRFRDLAIPVHALGMRHGRFPTAGDVVRLVRCGRRLAPDLVHGWMSHGNLGAMLVRAVARSRVPLLWSIHQTLGDFHTLPLPTRFSIRATARLSRGADAIVYVANASLVEHQAIGFSERNALFVPNGVDTARFVGGHARRAKARALLGIHDDAPVIGHVARFHPSKDQATLLAALRIVFSGGRSGCAVLVGHGQSEDNEELAAWLAAAQLTTRVKLLGARADIDQLLPGLDLFCLSSAYNEACPVAVLEAMSCGVRCIVTDIADSAWIVADTGGIAPARDPGALAAQIVSALDSPGEEVARASQRARERVLAHFSLDRMVERYRGVYTAALERRPVAMPGIS